MSQSPWNVSGNIGKEDGGMLASDEVGNLHEVDKKVGKIMQRVYLGPVPGEVGKLDAAFAMSEKAGNEFNVDVESVSSEHPMSDQSGRGDDDLNIGKLYSDVPHPPSPLSSLRRGRTVNKLTSGNCFQVPSLYRERESEKWKAPAVR
ncbi:hypothetical protein EV1_021090 [Malus domestica]